MRLTSPPLHPARALVAAALGGVVVLAGAAAMGQTGAPRSYSTPELIERLRPHPASQFRGIEIAPSPTGTTAAAKPSVDLAVNFAFGSAQLTADGELALDNLGRALEDPALGGSRFSIAGHTDAVGSAAFNQRLSEARAAAVRDYLVARFRIAGDRLETHGYGFSRLLDRKDPTNAVNRRVEITNIGTAP